MVESAAAFKTFAVAIAAGATESEVPDDGQRMPLLARRLGTLLQESLFTSGDDILASLEGETCKIRQESMPNIEFSSDAICACFPWSCFKYGTGTLGSATRRGKLSSTHLFSRS